MLRHLDICYVIITYVTSSWHVTSSSVMSSCDVHNVITWHHHVTHVMSSCDMWHNHTTYVTSSVMSSHGICDVIMWLHNVITWHVTSSRDICNIITWRHHESVTDRQTDISVLYRERLCEIHRYICLSGTNIQNSLVQIDWNENQMICNLYQNLEPFSHLSQHKKASNHHANLPLEMYSFAL